MQTPAPQTKATPPKTIDIDEDFAGEVLLQLCGLDIMLTSCLAQGATQSQNAGGMERARPRTGKGQAMSQPASLPQPARKGGAGGLTAEDQHLSQRASSQGSRSPQSDARQASQASGTQVSNLT